MKDLQELKEMIKTILEKKYGVITGNEYLPRKEKYLNIGYCQALILMLDSINEIENKGLNSDPENLGEIKKYFESLTKHIEERYE